MKLVRKVTDDAEPRWTTVTIQTIPEMKPGDFVTALRNLLPESVLKDTRQGRGQVGVTVSDLGRAKTLIGRSEKLNEFAKLFS